MSSVWNDRRDMRSLMQHISSLWTHTALSTKRINTCFSFLSWFSALVWVDTCRNHLTITYFTMKIIRVITLSFSHLSIQTLSFDFIQMVWIQAKCLLYRINQAVCLIVSLCRHGLVWSDKVSSWMLNVAATLYILDTTNRKHKALLICTYRRAKVSTHPCVTFQHAIQNHRHLSAVVTDTTLLVSGFRADFGTCSHGFAPIQSPAH